MRESPITYYIGAVVHEGINDNITILVLLYIRESLITSLYYRYVLDYVIIAQELLVCTMFYLNKRMLLMFDKCFELVIVL